jgi:chromosome partitioning protein
LKSIAFWNLKGGTGKTTTAGNVSSELRHYGRTLAIDADPQASLTSWLAPEGIQHELSDYMSGSVKVLPHYHSREGLDIIPSFAIGGELREWSETKLQRDPFAFSGLMDTLRPLYDFVVFDLHPAAGLLELSVLAECDEVILVANPEHFSSDGIESATAHLQTLREKRRARFRADRMVVNRMNRSYAAHKVLLEEIQGMGFRLYEIGQSQDIHDCIMRKRTIFEYAPGNRWTSEYQRLAKELR